PLQTEMTRLVDNENRLLRLASSLLGSEIEEFDKALEIAADELTRIVRVGRASIWTVDGDRVELSAVAERHGAEPPLPESVPVSVLEDIGAGSLASLRASMPATTLASRSIWAAAGRDAGGDREAGEGEFEHNRAFAEVMYGTGQPLGFVMIENTFAVGSFDTTHMSAVRSTAAMLGEALQRHRMEIELTRRATTDTVTGLRNRWHMTELIDEWLADGAAPRLGSYRHDSEDPSGVAVALLDLDRFKIVNESLGHAAGDHLLMLVAERLSTAVEGMSGAIGRLGGDEFMAVWRGVADAERARELAERLAAALVPPFTLDGAPVPITASIGLVLVENGAYGSPEVLRRAEEAMYRAKNGGGNMVETEDGRHLSRLVRRMQSEAELRAAIAGGALEAWYQGEWELFTGRLAGAEALVRWRHPTRGVLSAAQFVPLAEEMGVIGDVGTMMLRSAFSSMRDWRSGTANGPFTMRINVSAHQLRDSSLPELLQSLVSEYGVNPDHVCIELTESTLLGDPEGAAAILSRIRDLGVGLAIDDFGTGYSSLMYLKRLPLTSLKIDQAFVTGLPGDPIDTAVVAAVVELAGRLGISVTAEGVETEEQRMAVLELGCNRAQGYLFSRPEPPDDLAARLEAATPRIWVPPVDAGK
ncbi:MAG TPA: EAL domain-containing protein, partial [Acidimicrobiales bacterium]|nr:EAL domain-containing protein [Acidimicrobiales bacterium]